MKKADLQKLKLSVLRYNDNWRGKGGKLGNYICKHCNGLIQTNIPSVEDVADKGYWDSFSTCYNCGGTNFVTKYPNGTIETEAVK